MGNYLLVDSLYQEESIQVVQVKHLAQLQDSLVDGQQDNLVPERDLIEHRKYITLAPSIFNL